MVDAVHRALERFAQNSKLFALLDAAGVERLARAGELRAFGAGRVVVQQGEIGNDFYLISMGEVRVLVEEAGGEVARLGPGSFFGEIAVVTRQPRTATVECTQTSQLIRFEREPVLAILQDYPMVKEVLGGVGLMRSEENLQHVLGEGDGGLAEALEAEDPTAADVSLPLLDDESTVIDPTVNEPPRPFADLDDPTTVDAPEDVERGGHERHDTVRDVPHFDDEDDGL